MAAPDGQIPRRHVPIPGESRWDGIGPLCILFLVLLGISAIHTAQLASPGSQWRGQLIWFCAGAGLYVACARLDYHFLRRHAHWIYAGGVGLLLLVWTPLGIGRYGAVRWIRLLGFQLQPAEVAKFTTLVMLSALLASARIESLRESRAALLRILALFSLPWLLIFLQPDLGSALILPPVLLALLFLSGLSGRFFLLLFALAVAFLALLTWDIYRYRNFLDENGLRPDQHGGLYQGHSLLPLKDYQRNRILGFIAPAVVDPRGTGISWNLRQSLIAVGSGGLAGKGATNSSQAQLGYLPRSVATNDFLFSVLAEERGLLGSLCGLSLLTTLIINDLRIAAAARDRFGRHLAAGIAIFLLMHVAVNMGMTLGLMPITGVPLPFLSYGGSFLVVCCVLQGVVQSIYHRRRNLC
ncbi:MAG: rod shape-determining protein RodA [Puniceicoccales bacterium]|nr:rod shape-determining protein RodA [Puniceicoccales bacterium]